jgi:hypothetical protein
MELRDVCSILNYVVYLLLKKNSAQRARKRNRRPGACTLKNKKKNI